MNATEINLACKLYFKPCDLWKTGIAGRFKTVGAVISYLTLVVPAIMILIQCETKRCLDKNRINRHPITPPKISETAKNSLLKSASEPEAIFMPEKKKQINLVEMLDLTLNNIKVEFPIQMGVFKLDQYSKKDNKGLSYSCSPRSCTKEELEKELESINKIEEFVKKEKIALGNVSIRFVVQDVNEDLFYIEVFNKKQKDGEFFHTALFQNSLAQGYISANSATEWFKKSLALLDTNPSAFDYFLKGSKFKLNS